MALTRRRDTQKVVRQEDSLAPASAPGPAGPEEPVPLKVSAILVSHNQAPALRRAIEALERSEDRERLEILVVDCGSQDESPQLDSDFPLIVMMRLPHHFGVTKAMNIGTRTAKGEFVFYLSPEIEVAPDTVAKLAARLETDADCVAVCPLLMDTEGRPAPHVRDIPTRDTLTAACRGQRTPDLEIDFNAESVPVQYPGVDALMVRKQFVKGVNYFDQRYGQFWADADLAMQIARAQKKIRLYPSIRVIDHAEPGTGENDSLLAADRALGAAVFLGKYNGFLAGLGFRISATLRALIRFDFREFTALLTGQKLDGSQSG